MVGFTKTGRRSKRAGKHHKGSSSAHSPVAVRAVGPKGSVWRSCGGGVGQGVSPPNSPEAAVQGPPPFPTVRAVGSKSRSGVPAGGVVQGPKPQGVKRGLGGNGAKGNSGQGVEAGALLSEHSFGTRYSEGVCTSRNILVISRNPAEELLELPVPKGPPVALGPLGSYTPIARPTLILPRRRSHGELSSAHGAGVDHERAHRGPGAHQQSAQTRGR